MKKLLLFLSLALLMVSFTSCNKESEKNILGSWKLVLEQYSFESSDGDYETENYAVEENFYYIFKKNGVISFYGEDGLVEKGGKWAYIDGKIVIDDMTYTIENFSHKEMDLVSIDYVEDYDHYWERYTLRLHFKREKAPKE